jgi:hypothetical protein
VNIGEEVIQIEKGISYDLPRSVVSDVSPSVDLVVAGLMFFEPLIIYEEISGVSAFAQGINVGMLHKQECVSRLFRFFRMIAVKDLLINYFLEELLLKIPAFLIIQ